MKIHEIKSQIEEVTGFTALIGDQSIEVLVTGDKPEMVPVVRRKLEAAGINFTQSRHRKFKGATFLIPLKNVGTAFYANWEYETGQ